MLLFSAATDGKIAVWDLTPATSGPPSDAPTPPIPCLSIAAHQSGVNSLAVWPHAQGPLDDGCLVTVSSGGDDGQLMVSTIRVEFLEDRLRTVGVTQDQPQSHLGLHLLSQLSFPSAHAAPLTALKLLRPGLIVTTSCDQRVCLWELCNTSINHKGVLCSHVADASGLAVWEEPVVQDGRRTAASDADKVLVCSRAEGQTHLERGGLGHKDQDVVGGSWEKTDDSILKMDKETKYCGKIQTNAQDGNETITEIALRSSCERKGGNEITGWVLVCGQGFQLLRIRNKDNDEAIQTHERRKTEEDKTAQ